MQNNINMLKREKNWYERNYEQFNHNADERKGFVNGIDYCINLLEASENEEHLKTVDKLNTEILMDR